MTAMDKEKMTIVARSRLEILQTYKLLQCVRQQDTDQISKLCTQGVPMLINFQEPKDGECALHLAARSNKPSISKYLISIGAVPDVQDFQGRTPIMKAAELGHDRTVELLVKCGADMKIRDNEGKDMMFYCICATRRHKICLSIALESCSDLGNVTKNGDSVLSIACQKADENRDLCLLLIDRGADPRTVNKITGRSTLSVACDSDCPPVVRALLGQGADPNVVDRKKHAPLHFAAQKGSFEVVKCLIAHGADCKLLDSDGNNGLHFAARGGFVNICKFLSQRGCNPKLSNDDGFTPRVLAMERYHGAAAKELRKAEKLFMKYSKTAMLNPVCSQLLTLYDWIHERQDIVRREFAKEAIPLGQDGLNETALKGGSVSKESFLKVLVDLEAPIPRADSMKKLLAAHDGDRRGTVEIEEFISGKKYIEKTHLMSVYEAKPPKGKKGSMKGRKGTKMQIDIPICFTNEGPRRHDGGPPLVYVERQLKWIDKVRFDRDHQPKHPLEDDSAWYIRPPEKQFVNITEAAKRGDTETLKAAFQDGTPVDTTDKFSKTPLMAAAAEGNHEMTKYLLSLGASVGARDNFKWTALHHACHSGQLDVVKELAVAGSDLNAVTWNEASALMRAVEGGNPEVVRYLLQCGVDVQHKTKKDKTALDVARDWAHNEMYWMIKDACDAIPKHRKASAAKKPPGPSAPKPLTIAQAQTKPAVEVLTTSERYRNRAGSRFNRYIQGLAGGSKAPCHGSRKNGGVLDLAIGFASGNRKDVSFFAPKKAWCEEPTTRDLKRSKEEKRARFGFEVDFQDYVKPLEKNIARVTREVREQNELQK